MISVGDTFEVIALAVAGTVILALTVRVHRAWCRGRAFLDSVAAGPHVRGRYPDGEPLTAIDQLVLARIEWASEHRPVGEPVYAHEHLEGGAPDGF